MQPKRVVRLLGETIEEYITKEDGLGFGVTVAEIEWSTPHLHRKTREAYQLLEGELTVHIGCCETHVLRSHGEGIFIPLNMVHWAERVGERPARVVVFTVPAWSREDHIVVDF